MPSLQAKFASFCQRLHTKCETRAIYTVRKTNVVSHEVFVPFNELPNVHLFSCVHCGQLTKQVLHYVHSPVVTPFCAPCKQNFL